MKTIDTMLCKYLNKHNLELIFYYYNTSSVIETVYKCKACNKWAVTSGSLNTFGLIEVLDELPVHIRDIDKMIFSSNDLKEKYLKLF